MSLIFTDQLTVKNGFQKLSAVLELRLKRGHKETTEQVHEGSVCLDPPFFAGG